MEKIVSQTLLYDFYGELLTDHQKNIYENVVFGDLSLSEAAEEAGISRQGVHDIIKRCTKMMEEYEGKLNLIEHHINIIKLAEQIKDLADECCEADDASRQIKLERIKELAALMTDEA